MTTEQSVEDLMCECYNAALALCYAPQEDGRCLIVADQPVNISDEFWNEIWQWSDGLYQKWFFDRMSGRCSLKAFLVFSIEKEENYMKDFLARMKSVSN